MADVDNLLKARDTHEAAGEVNGEKERVAADAMRSCEASRMRWQKEAFQAAVKGAPLPESLSLLARMLTDSSSNGDVRTAFYTANAEGTTLHPIWGAGTMPDEYLKENNGFAIGEDALACGLAVPTGEPLVTADVHTEPRWKPWTHIADKYGYRGCWSFPIRTNEETPIGTFAVYFREPRAATPHDLALADAVTHAAAIIIAQHRVQTALAGQREFAQSIVETLHEPLLTLHPDLTVQSVNPAFYTHFEVNSAETVGRKIYDLGNGQWNIPALRVLLEDVLPDSHVFNDYEVTHDFETLGRRVMLMNGRRLDHLQLILLGIRDITDRKAAEASLREREEELLRMNVTLSQRLRELQVAEKDLRESRFATLNVLEDAVAARDSLEAEMRERKQATEALSESEGRFRLMANVIPQIIWITDAEGRLQFVNQHWSAYTGREFTPQTSKAIIRDLAHPEDISRISKRFQQALASGQTYIDEHRIRSASGEYRWFLVRGEPYRDAATGKITHWFGATIDIHDRKQTEEALRASEDQMRTLADSVPQLIWTNTAEGEADYFNQRWYEYSGLSFEESAGLGWQKIVHADDAPASSQRWRQALAAGRVFDAEYRLRRADGQYRWFIGRNVPLKDSKGRVTSWFGSATDIHDLKEAEAALRQSEARFRAMYEQTNVGIAQMDATGRFISTNPGYCAIVGYSEEELRNMRVMDVTDAEDWKRQQKFSAQLAKGEINEYTIEKRYRRKDGGSVWVNKTATLVRGESGDPLYVLAVVQEITERKETEAALRESEERYRLMVDGARDYAIFMVNPSNEIVYWSAGAERVFGWSAEEAIGQSGELIFTPEDRATEAEEKEIEIALRDGTAPDKRWHLRKDGARIWVDGVMRRLDDEKTGALRGFAKIARDATEQQRAEEQLHRAHDELEQRVRQRTAELRSKNRLLQQEVQRRQKLEDEILNITERERARIGQDLHDSLCQELTATAFLLKSRGKAIESQSKAAADSLAEAAATVNANAGLARDLARGLHPFELGSAGLPTALRELCSRTNGQVSCRCDCPRYLHLDPNVAMNLYRIAQEAANNALKHARASEIVIRLRTADRTILLSISDNGSGMRSQKRKKKTMGIQMMKYRADVCGGKLEIESGRGCGTTVTCRLPLRQ